MVLALTLSACSSDDSPDTAEPTTTTAAVRSPKATPAALEGPITVGDFSGPADPRPPDFAAIGYTQEEFFASGTATAYATEGALGVDGKWKVTPSTTAPYKTRIVVRRPTDPAKFHGTVVVEWLNVTVVEAAPEWAYTGDAIVDAGAAWVGVSAQALGVVGGTSALSTGPETQAPSTGLRGNNPTRYGSLEHPGDQYAFDIYSQIGAAVRTGAAPVIGTAKARKVVAAGESQSAAYLTGYINGIHPVADVFDGYFVHSRGAGAANPGGTMDIRGTSAAYRFRTDLDVPVLAFETETDVGPLLGYAKARQPDTTKLRVWETAGTAHADAFLVGGTFAPCPAGINDGPQHYVTEAAMAAMLLWVETGTAPPHGTRIETEGPRSTTIKRDARGIALGGIRTPSVDVPVKVLTGASSPDAPVLCALFGGSTPLDQATLTTLYPSDQAYVAAFDQSLDHVIGQGFVRAADRHAFAAEARAVTF